jgi:hypothetical protein
VPVIHLRAAVHERRQVTPVKTDQLRRHHRHVRNAAVAFSGEVARLADRHPRTMHGMDDLPPIRVEYEVLHLAAQPTYSSAA